MTLRTLVASKSRSTFDRVKEAFVDVDCEIITAQTMSLALYLARKNFPDAIIAALELSDGSGIQLLQELKSELELSSIPFALVSSQSDCELIKELQTSSPGIDAVIDDSLNGRELYETIMKLIRGYLAVKEDRAADTPE